MEAEDTVNTNGRTINGGGLGNKAKNGDYKSIYIYIYCTGKSYTKS